MLSKLWLFFIFNICEILIAKIYSDLNIWYGWTRVWFLQIEKNCSNPRQTIFYTHTFRCIVMSRPCVSYLISIEMFKVEGQRDKNRPKMSKVIMWYKEWCHPLRNWSNLRPTIYFTQTNSGITISCAWRMYLKLHDLIKV